MTKEKKALINVMNELDRAEFNADESGLSDNGVSFYKALQQMSREGLKKINYSDYAFKQKKKGHEIYITISRKRPWF